MSIIKKQGNFNQKFADKAGIDTGGIPFIIGNAA